jgi:N-acetylglucosamine kinase-like BadF-type ATPase
MKYFLGVDAGGTKTRAVVIDESSTILGEAFGGPANYHNVGLVEATTNVVATVAQLLEKVKLSQKDISWCTIGIASCDTQKDYKLLFDAFSQGPFSEMKDRLIVINDAKIGLYSATLPPAIVVVCGTGANVYGKNAHGDEALAGNWGMFLGDKGSGYILGKRLFETMMEVYDGMTVETTILTQKLQERLNVSSSEEINDWYNEAKPSVHQISDFAVMVIETAEEGDEVARQLVDKTIKELGRALMTVVRRLKMENEAVRLVTTGGLFESKYFRSLFEGHVTALLSHVRIIKPLVSNAVGAAIMGKNTWDNKQKKATSES